MVYFTVNESYDNSSLEDKSNFYVMLFFLIEVSLIYNIVFFSGIISRLYSHFIVKEMYDHISIP